MEVPNIHRMPPSIHDMHFPRVLLKKTKNTLSVYYVITKRQLRKKITDSSKYTIFYCGKKIHITSIILTNFEAYITMLLTISTILYSTALEVVHIA